VLSKGKASPPLVARVFEIKLLQFIGYGPELQICSICGNDLEEPIFFCENGRICHDCNSKTAFIVSPSFLSAFNYISTADFSAMFSFTASQKTLDDLNRAFEMIFNTHIGVNIKSRELI
jgi:DNA repair protein RecO (recombination protein O)